jgi:uncharacterized protein (UPF0262 family)
MQQPLRTLSPDVIDTVPEFPMTDKHMITGNYIQAIKIDPETLPIRNIRHECERNQAVYDLLQRNNFKLNGGIGPYNLGVSQIGNRLFFHVNGMHSPEAASHPFSLLLLRKVFKDYRDICENYFMSIKEKSEREIETIDMGRRALHNDGALIIQEYFVPLIEVDFETARLLFNLIYSLQWKG